MPKFTSVELAILDDVHQFPGGHAVPRKGLWIRAHLISAGSDYSYSMFKRWRAFAHRAGFPPGNRDAFNRYVAALKALELIEAAGEETSPERPQFTRVYYKANDQLLTDEAWLHPFAVLYGDRSTS